MSESKLKLLNFVGGEFSPAQSFLRLPSAFDSNVFYEAADSDLFAAIQCIQTAQKAFYGVVVADLQKNIEVCERFFAHLEKDKTTIASDLAQFQGSTTHETLQYDIELGLAALREALKEAKNFDSKKFHIQATGLVVVLAPAILSFKTICERLAPALIAGNSVIVKLSSKNPRAGYWLSEAAMAAGFEKGLVNFLYGRGEVIGPILCSHPSVRAVSFAGSLKVAEQVIKNAAPHFKKLQVSTTQKNIAAVLSDADLDLAVSQILRGTIFLSGQSPFSIHRVFVVEAVAAKFTEKLRAEVAKLHPLTQFDEKSEFLVSHNILTQGSVFETMTGTAKEAHAKIMEIPQAFSGTTFKPIFTLDMTNCSTLQQDDLQSPFVIVTTVKYQHEVQKYANVGYYGSDAFLFGSREKCEKVLTQLQARNYFFNEWRVKSEPVVSSRQTFFGNSDFRAFGHFYSELKILN